MLPHRYLGFRHAFNVIRKEEGFKGLYRGYAAYLLAISIYFMTVPFLGEIYMSRDPISGYYE